MKYYDVTFHELSGKTIIKRDVPSEKDGFDVWQDACVSYSDTEILLLINNGTYSRMNRHYLVRIDAEEVPTPTEKVTTRRDEITGVINTLSNMGF
ncbi:MAG: hypothetical protein ACK5NA_04250 [Enterococcus sp.]